MKGKTLDVLYRMRGNVRRERLMVDGTGKETRDQLARIIARWLNVRDENVIVLASKIVP